MPEINANNSRSYAQRKRLELELVTRALNEYRYVIVRNDAGRFTAIFPSQQFAAEGGFPAAMDHGFLVI